MDGRAADMEDLQAGLAGLIRGGSSKGSHPDLSDSLWRTQSRHQLGKIRSYEDFHKLQTDIGELEESVFDQQDNQVRLFLRRKGYSSREIDTYLEQGGMPTLIRATYRNYMSFLETISRSYMEDQVWNEGRAFWMLDHHAKKLLALRTTCYSKSHFLLKVYAYLRDARPSGFQHTSMLKQVWKEVTTRRVIDKEPRPTPREGEARCNHCRNAAFHDLFKIPQSKVDCPFKHESQSKARKAASHGYTLFTATPSMSKEAVIAQALTLAG